MDHQEPGSLKALCTEDLVWKRGKCWVDEGWQVGDMGVIDAIVLLDWAFLPQC